MKIGREIKTASPEETLSLAEKFSSVLRAGDLVALRGNLGSGKTVFVKGLAKGLGVKDYRYVNSPSFVVIKEYPGKMPLYHFDVYRLDSRGFCETMDYEKYFYSTGVTAVEWADKIQELLPEEYFEVFMEPGEENSRTIGFAAVGEDAKRRLDVFLASGEDI